MLPDGRGGARLVPLRSAELIYNKHGRSSKRYGDLFEESQQTKADASGEKTGIEDRTNSCQRLMERFGDETSTTDNIQSLTGKWQATEESHHLLDSKLVEANQTGFVIAIDKQFGESYRKTSDTYENQYREFLEQKGHVAVVSGTIKFDYGGESELMISRNDGAWSLS